MVLVRFLEFTPKSSPKLRPKLGKTNSWEYLSEHLLRARFAFFFSSPPSPSFLDPSASGTSKLLCVLEETQPSEAGVQRGSPHRKKKEYPLKRRPKMGQLFWPGMVFPQDVLTLVSQKRCGFENAETLQFKIAPPKSRSDSWIFWKASHLQLVFGVSKAKMLRLRICDFKTKRFAIKYFFPRFFFDSLHCGKSCYFWRVPYPPLLSPC